MPTLGLKNHGYVLQSTVSTFHDSEAAISFTPWGDRMSHQRGLLGVNAYSKLETRSLRRLVTMGPKESEGYSCGNKSASEDDLSRTAARQKHIDSTVSKRTKQSEVIAW